MDRDQILAIIERIGSENPPSATELETARNDLARLIHQEASAEQPNLETLTSLRKAYADAGVAHVAAQAAEDRQRQEINDLLADIPNPDVAATVEPEPTPESESDVPAEPADVIVPDEVIEPLPVAAAATPPMRTIPLRDAVSRVRDRPPAPAQMTVDLGTGNEIYIAGTRVMEPPTIREAAQAFERAVRSPSTGKDTIVRFDTHFADGQVLPTGENAVTRFLEENVGPEAIAASGGCCSLPVPIRTQTVLNSAARPLRDSLAQIGVTEAGAVTYFPAICMPDEGAALWTCAEDESVDPEDDATWKECVVVDCPTAETTIVDPIYKCLTIGEFQRRFATEQWVAILQATLAYQARIAEQRVWARMLATVGDTWTAPGTGSVFANWAQGLQTTVDSINQDQRYIGVQINHWLPSIFPGVVANDFYARRLINVPDPTVVMPLIQSVASNAGVRLTFSPDIDQMTHATPAYPATLTSVIAPEGYYSFLDGGQFDLGIEIRDLDLARQNAVAAFAESFEGVLARGCNAWRMNITNTICADAAGCGSL